MADWSVLGCSILVRYYNNHWLVKLIITFILSIELKPYQKFLRFQGLTTFLGVARLACSAGALARESFWVAQRFQRCDSMYVTEHAISPLSFRTCFSREESAFPSWTIPPFLILADAFIPPAD